MASKKAKINLKSKWILIVVVFIVLFVVSYSLYSKQNYSNNQPSNNSSIETANWKIYENPMFRYSFKYPRNWNVEYLCHDRSKATDECTISEIRLTSYPYKYIGQDLPEEANGIIISITNKFNPKELSLNDFASSFYNLEGIESSNYPVSEELIGSSTFVKVGINKNDKAHTPSYFIEDPNRNILEIVGSITAKNFEYEKMPISEYNNYIDTFNTILSTFKFTN